MRPRNRRRAVVLPVSLFEVIRVSSSAPVAAAR
jgi:hypothetical protein